MLILAPNYPEYFPSTGENRPEYVNTLHKYLKSRHSPSVLKTANTESRISSNIRIELETFPLALSHRWRPAVHNKNKMRNSEQKAV